MKTLALLFLLYLIGCVLAAIFEPDSIPSSNSSNSDTSSDDDKLFDKVYSDGSWRVKGPLGSDYYYSDGKSSYVGFWGEENRSNGEMVTQNGFVYDKNGEHIGYEFEDVLGITHRYDKN